MASSSASAIVCGGVENGSLMDWVAARMKSRKSILSISRPHLSITITTYLSSFTLQINFAMEATSPRQADYNEALRKVSSPTLMIVEVELMGCLQISNSLENTLNTFGRSSRQYHAVLEILKECLRDIENDKKKSAGLMVDPDMLSVAMGFLEIKE